ncbi:cell cycle checkpoint protein RAD17-like [Biomphalaria glabrata]|uniref:Cell cycle checkpoint protein RAD17-like n=1 Tax=Biomphalaria glabrata TaxID=6526 RepID=A0A9U8E2W4_BIOGL|nr:cell cycle checkpoint protein RAD17-like [Biomphalaria glabrata]XP_013070428.2 cell cycle checkpoint protein RAD17-like [Biomphalaria glabrata]
MSWVTSSFGNFGDITAPEKHKSSSNPQCPSKSEFQRASAKDVLSRKRPRETPHTSRNQSQSKSFQNFLLQAELWSEKYKPTSRAELAIHKKKVEEVADWLLQNASKNGKKKAAILLITGPAGAGKSVCLHLLCKELGLSVQEWSNNSELAADQYITEDFNRSERSTVDTYSSQSQSALFHNFLLRANKYQKLDIMTSSVDSNQNSGQLNTVIVVKDIPNNFLRDPTQFHTILSKYQSTGRSPLVIIMTESNNSSSNIQKLFPKDLQHQLCITNISFNPVAPTILSKVLTKVINKEVLQGLIKQPSASVIETIAMSSAGDMRSALNALQFACKLDTSDLASFCCSTSTSKKKSSSTGTKFKSKTSKQTDDKLNVLVIGAKDKSVFLFHTIGKVLYFKRTEANPSEPNLRLPSHLKIHERDPLSLHPEEIVSHTHVSADYFNSFLHENYVDFLTTVEDLERATQYFSDADYLSALWTAKEELQDYSLSIAIRGYIHSNTDFCHHDSIRKNQGWKPLHKSHWFHVSKQTCDNLASARHLFRGYHWEPEVLCTEIIPYIGLTNPTLHDPGQIRFVQEMTQFIRSNSFSRPRQERLNENDVITEEDHFEESDALESQFPVLGSKTGVDGASLEDEDTVSSSQASVQKQQQDEEELIIEEFED